MAILAQISNKLYTTSVTLYDRYWNEPSYKRWGDSIPFTMGSYKEINGYRGPRQYIDYDGNLFPRKAKKTSPKLEKSRSVYRSRLGIRRPPDPTETQPAKSLRAFHPVRLIRMETKVKGHCWFEMNPPYYFPGGWYGVRVGDDSTTGLQHPSILLLDQQIPSQEWLDPVAQVRLSQKLIAKLRQPEFDAGIALGELPETFEGLHSVLKTLKKRTKAFRKLQLLEHVRHEQKLKPDVRFPKTISKLEKFLLNDRKARGRFHERLANAWLGYRYAILPTLGTVSDLISALNGQLGLSVPRPSRVVVGEIEEHVHTNAGKHLNIAGSGRWPFWLEGLLEYKKEVLNRCGCYVTFEGRNLKDALGLGPFDLARVTWELIPFSFAVDWFLDVGTWLDSLRPRNYKIVYAWMSRDTQVDEVAQAVNLGQGIYPETYSGEFYVCYGDERSTFHYHMLERRKVEAQWLENNRIFPVLSSPTRFGLKQKTDCVALLTQISKLLRA